MTDSTIYRATTTAPVNIAVVKYWGKRDVQLNLPTNSSLSVTLSQDDLRAFTTATCSASYPPQDSLVLNGQEVGVDGSRTQACLRELRARRQKLEEEDSSLPKLSSMPLHIASENNFPTAAGLASSAAGFAALVRAIADLYQLPDSPSELSVVARMGSGSACRSLFGGYVAWRMGEKMDGSDSRAEVVEPTSHWPNMRAVILVVRDEVKLVGSSIGMQQTANTSALFQHRIKEVVPKAMAEMEDAIHNRDFPKFAETTMRESNSFHATCLDSFPPISYLVDSSFLAIRVIHKLNEAAGRTVAAYTFDAGSNPVIYYLDEDADVVLGTLYSILPKAEGWKQPEQLQQYATTNKVTVDVNGLQEKLAESVQRVIQTSIGEGPIPSDKHLI